MTTETLTPYNPYRIAMDRINIEEFMMAEYLSASTSDAIVLVEICLPRLLGVHSIDELSFLLFLYFGSRMIQ